MLHHSADILTHFEINSICKYNIKLQAALLEPYVLLVSTYVVHQNCFEETISGCAKGGS